MKYEIQSIMGLMLLSVVLFSCKPNVEIHKHTYSTEWTSNETEHWHEATCEHSSEEIDRTSHILDGGKVTKEPTILTKGEKTFKCSVCERFLKREYLPELYSSPVDVDTKLAPTAASKYVYFGVFPQKIMNSSVTVDETVSVTMGGNIYYQGNDGNWYAKVLENKCDPGYEYTYSDNTSINEISAGNYRYFKVEPIKWKVLTSDYNNTGNILLVADHILTANVPFYSYNKYYGYRPMSDGTSICSNNYKYSQIRAYLNGLDYYYNTTETETVIKKDYTGIGFLQTAFTTEGQMLIATTEVDNSMETTGYSKETCTEDYWCDNTSDKIFLLSESEVINSNYGFPAVDVISYNNARTRVPTDYALANNARLRYSAGWWWLRSPEYKEQFIARFCDSFGNTTVTNSVEVDFTDLGVVPALTLLATK